MACQIGLRSHARVHVGGCTKSTAPSWSLCLSSQSSTRMGFLETAHVPPTARPSKVLLHCGEALGDLLLGRLCCHQAQSHICAVTDWSAKESWLRGLREVGLDVELWPDLTCFEDVAFVVCWYVLILARIYVRLRLLYDRSLYCLCVSKVAKTSCADRNPPDELFSKVSCNANVSFRNASMA